MREIRKHISILLFVVMVMNSVICVPVYGGSNSEIEIAENEVFDGENTEEAIETTTESIVEDDVESSSSVIIDILDKVLKKDTEDEILSGAAIDYEIDESGLPSDVSELLDKSYEGLSDYEKFAMNTYLFVREDTMGVCYDKGYLIRDSVPYALLMQTMEVDFITAENMMVNYGSQKAALESAELYSERLYEYACFKDENIKNEVKDYIIDGCNIDDVLKAYGIAVYTGKDIADVIRDKNSESLYTEEEITDEIINLCNECYINAKTAKEIIESDDYENFAFDYSEILKILKEGDDETAMFASTVEDADIGYDSAFKKGALSYIEGLGANVDPNTGAISYTENICSIPGAAGLDLNISLVYSSSANASFRAIDDRANYAHNWRYAFPYLTNKEGQSIVNGGMSYLTLSSGDTYEMVNVGGYYIPSSIYTDEIKLYNDNTHQGGTNSYYKLTYKNGNVDYFNDEGLWIKTVDKFGNKIEVIQSGTGLMKIKDTNNNIVTIQMSGNVQTITRPDNSKITINYSKKTQGAYTRCTLDKITYPGNVSTEFSYEFSYKDNYRNALLNKIKTATELEKHFSYEWTDKLKYSWNAGMTYLNYEADKYDYARIKQEYLSVNNKVCDKKTYEYNRNFMIASANFAFKCMCCPCGRTDDYNSVNYCDSCIWFDYNGNNRIDSNEWIDCIAPCECACVCKPYIILGTWYCNKECENNCNTTNCLDLYIENDSSQNYSTTVKSEGGTDVKYTFNTLK